MYDLYSAVCAKITQQPVGSTVKIVTCENDFVRLDETENEVQRGHPR